MHTAKNNYATWVVASFMELKSLLLFSVLSKDGVASCKHTTRHQVTVRNELKDNASPKYCKPISISGFDYEGCTSNVGMEEICKCGWRSL